jgi:hypothetical protein
MSDAATKAVPAWTALRNAEPRLVKIVEDLRQQPSDGRDWIWRLIDVPAAYGLEMLEKNKQLMAEVDRLREQIVQMEASGYSLKMIAEAKAQALDEAANALLSAAPDSPFAVEAYCKLRARARSERGAR